MTKKKRLIMQLFPTYLLVTVVSMAAVAWYSSNAMNRFFLRKTEADLMARAQMFTPYIAGLLNPLDAPAIDALCKEIGALANTRITVVLPQGKVVGDSQESPQMMDNHADRPEILEASTGRPGASTRFSLTIRENMMYVATPVFKDGHLAAIVRTAFSMTFLEQAQKDVRWKIAGGGLVILFFAALVSLYVSRRITRPIEQIKKWSETISKGDFSFVPPQARSEEIESLSLSLSRMGQELKERIEFMTRQRNQMEAVLSSMTEGVIAIDMDQKILSMNQSAGAMLACSPQAAQSRAVQEVVRNTDFHGFVDMALKNDAPVERDFVLASGAERFFKARGVVLRDADAKRLGVLVVLNDVTQITQLENMRKDFVANVSHEIKTPITAIKGFVETLADGAIDNRADALRFLEIIARHTDRLKAIVEDLLKLSRIEQAGGQGLPLSTGNIKQALDTAVQICGPAAAAANVVIEVACPESLTAKADLTLLEQAVVNLLENAVKYSKSGSQVQVTARKTDSEVLISVADHGPGIPAEHLPRLFERFYRVDKARSRSLGGTGLGLSIVKHIMAAHGGHVTVESTPGSGSAFTLHLPN